MESALTQLAAFPATGITIKAATTSTAIQHFIRLRTDISRAPETVVAAEPFRRALSEIWVEFDPNGSNAGGFILLIAAARRLEPLSTAESERMVAALERIIDMTITARSATPATSTNILPPTVTASPSSVTNTTSTRATRSRSSSLSSLSSVDLDLISSAPALSAKRSISVNSLSPRSSKRPRTNQERTQDLDELNRNSTTHRYFDANSPPVSAMIATAILSTVDKRATEEQILDYFTQNYSMNQIATSWRERIRKGLEQRPYFQSFVKTEDTYWEIIEGEFQGPFEFKAGVARNRAQILSTLPPIVISIPSNIQSRSWKDYITEAILSTPSQRMSADEVTEYLMETHETQFGGQGVKKLGKSVGSAITNKKNGFEKGSIATNRVGIRGPNSYYYHIIPTQVGSNHEVIGMEEAAEIEDRIQEVEELDHPVDVEQGDHASIKLESVKEEVKEEESVKGEVKEEESVKLEELVKVEIKEELEEDKKFILKIKEEE